MSRIPRELKGLMGGNLARPIKEDSDMSTPDDSNPAKRSRRSKSPATSPRRVLRQRTGHEPALLASAPPPSRPRWLQSERPRGGGGGEDEGDEDCDLQVLKVVKHGEVVVENGKVGGSGEGKGKEVAGERAKGKEAAGTMRVGGFDPVSSDPSTEGSAGVTYGADAGGDVCMANGTAHKPDKANGAAHKKDGAANGALRDPVAQKRGRAEGRGAAERGSKPPGGRKAGGRDEAGMKEVTKREENDTCWVGLPMEEDEVIKHYPQRKLASSFAQGLAQWRKHIAETKSGKGQRKETELADQLALLHFRKVHFGEHEVGLGDYVLVEADEGDVLIVEVTELYESVEGVRLAGVTWFYKPEETRLLVEAVGKNGEMERFYPVDPGKQIFKAACVDNQKYSTVVPVDSFEEPIKVVRVAPGHSPPEDCHWWNLEHDRSFFTFQTPPDVVPKSRERYKDEKRSLFVLDLYCGAGGMSFMDTDTDKVCIKTKWAVDTELDMCRTFEANFKDAHVLNMGVDEFLQLSKNFKALSDRYPDDWKPPGKEEEEDNESGEESEKDSDVFEVEAILNIRHKDTAKRGDKGQEEGQLLDDLTEHNSSIEFKIRWKGYDESEDSWEPESCLINCEEVLARFVQECRREQRIPLPGQVGIVMGGPPCQGVSGLNRHAEVVDVLHDSRNRQVTAFYRVVEWFSPAFVVMENVLDILKKQDGAYAKFAISQLLNLGYQSRLGILAACDFGVPQGRYRCFLYGAKAGEEQLPPLPEPTHRTIFKTSVPRVAHDCFVTFQSEAAWTDAYPAVTLGDILDLPDLPKVSNFSITERMSYASEPLRPFQKWLRRPPPPGERCAEERAKKADEYMKGTHDAVNAEIISDHRGGGEEAVGRRYFNNRDPQTSTTSYAGQVWAEHLKSFSTAAQRQAEEDAMQARKKALAIKVGKQVLDELSKARRAQGKVRDHRPLTCNVDDYLRCCAVPKGIKGANYRQMKGVVTLEDGTCCAGHTHAALVKKGVSYSTACKGGGTRTQAPSSKEKIGRVDHHDKSGWRGTKLEGCPATTEWLESGDLLCPRWCITYMRGKSKGRHGCFGRCHFSEVQPTVVGRAEPHNLSIVHPREDRVLSIRENARSQGFPDYFPLVGLAEKRKKGTANGLPYDNGSVEKGWVRSEALNKRYIQMGNAVCPAVAAAIGRCIALAAVGQAPADRAVLAVPDEEYDKVIRDARAEGLRFWVEEHPDQVKERRLIWERNEESEEADEDEESEEGDDDLSR